jgi:hypothetical protein
LFAQTLLYYAIATGRIDQMTLRITGAGLRSIPVSIITFFTLLAPTISANSGGHTER